MSQDKLDRMYVAVLATQEKVGEIQVDVGVLKAEVENLKGTRSRWETAIVAAVVSGIGGVGSSIFFLLMR